jgi:hypothetical protein
MYAHLINNIISGVKNTEAINEWLAFLGPTINDRIKRKHVYLWDPVKRA